MHTPRTIHALLLLSCFCALMFVRISGVHAQTSEIFHLTAMPPRVEVTGTRGSTIQKVIKVRNGSTEPQLLETQVEDFIVGEDGEHPIPASSTMADRYSMRSWVTVSPTKFSLNPKQTQSIDVLIKIPDDAIPGGHYAMVMHKLQDTPEGSGAGPGVSARVGTLLYVTVEGTISEEAFIRDLSVPAWNEAGPLTITYKIENQSEVHIAPTAHISIFDMLGRQIDEIKVEEKNIFPLTSRAFSAVYPRYWGLGQYTARITVPFGTHGKVTQAEIQFWIIPLKFIIALILAIVSTLAMLAAIRRHLKHTSRLTKKDMKHLQEHEDEIERGRRE